MARSPDESGRKTFLPPKKHTTGISRGEGVARVFADLNRKFQEQEVQRRAIALSLPYFYLTGFPIEQTLLSLVSLPEAAAARAIPFFKEGSLLKVAVAEPENPNLKLLFSFLENKKYKIEIYLVSESSIDSALQQYKKILPHQHTLKQDFEIGEGSQVLQDLKNLPNRGPALLAVSATELLSLILGGAITLRASDVHLEPEQKILQVRFRVDGVLADAVALPLAVLHTLLSRIKLLSGLKLNVTTTAQDGRFTVRAKEKALDLRVSVLPSAHGETVVMRILGIQEMGFDIEELGLRGHGLELIYEELKKPNGMILTTGPTGSGKTTTLYSFLNYLNKPGVKIITLEDPVEYQLEGIIQTPIDRAAGIDFARALRSVLRQDPDILMVGEIRDFETAETAAQAALTGHVVLSTLHTNDAAGAIPRLLDLGVKPVTLAPALNALIAQRLLRKICQNCRELYRPTQNELQHVKLSLSQIPLKAEVKAPEHLVFYRSRGCAECHNLGYRGRIGAFEVFAVDEKIEKLIYGQASSVDIKKAAVEQGMLSMQQDGILKAVEGITDLAEVWRVTEE